jgi:hypothetical protein
MNKKSYALFLAVLFVLLIVSNFMVSADQSAIDYSNSIVNASTKIAEASSNFLGGTSGSGLSLTSNWANLGKQWKDSLLKMPVIHAFDLFFQGINFVFLGLFGINYSLSLAFLFTMILWFLFFFKFYDILKIASLFSKWVCLIISLGLTILLAQVGLFSMIINAIIQLFFGPQTWWMKVIIGVLIVFGLVMLFAFIKKFGKKMEENKKKRKDEENRIKLETGAKAGEELSRAVSKP